MHTSTTALVPLLVQHFRCDTRHSDPRKGGETIHAAARLRTPIDRAAAFKAIHAVAFERRIRTPKRQDAREHGFLDGRRPLARGGTRAHRSKRGALRKPPIERVTPGRLRPNQVKRGPRPLAPSQEGRGAT